MKYYKELLLKKLSDTGWELVEENEDTDWWLESWWRIRSNKQFYGYEIFILFLVDPMYDGNNKSSAVWAVGAHEEIPTRRPINEGVCEMDLVKGKFDEKLTKFVGALNEHRNKNHS